MGPPAIKRIDGLFGRRPHRTIGSCRVSNVISHGQNLSGRPYGARHRRRAAPSNPGRAPAATRSKLSLSADPSQEYVVVKPRNTKVLMLLPYPGSR